MLCALLWYPSYVPSKEHKQLSCFLHVPTTNPLASLYLSLSALNYTLAFGKGFGTHELSVHVCNVRVLLKVKIKLFILISSDEWIMGVN